jgi:hypothetical protein
MDQKEQITMLRKRVAAGGVGNYQITDVQIAKLVSLGGIKHHEHNDAIDPEYILLKHESPAWNEYLDMLNGGHCAISLLFRQGPTSNGTEEEKALRWLGIQADCREILGVFYQMQTGELDEPRKLSHAYLNDSQYQRSRFLYVGRNRIEQMIAFMRSTSNTSKCWPDLSNVKAGEYIADILIHHPNLLIQVPIHK